MTVIRFAQSTGLVVSLLFAPVLMGCSPIGEKKIRSEGAVLELIYTGSETIELKLINASERPLKIPSQFNFAGRGGGNVFAIVLNRLGQVEPSCAYIDKIFRDDSVSILGPKEEIEVWGGAARNIQQWYCLGPGNYTVVFGYLSPAGEATFSHSIKLSGGGKGNVQK